MKRLFLTSFGLSAFTEFIGKDPKKVTIAFIPTAADLYEMWIQRSLVTSVTVTLLVWLQIIF